MAGIIEAIARWSRSGVEFGVLARLRARHAIADTIGCMLAGAGDPAVRAVRAAFAGSIADGPRCTLAGGGQGAEGLSALVNGTAAHALDYDDNFRPGASHASAVLVPALLGPALARGTSGRSLVDAYLVGLEAQAAVGRGVNPSHYTAGWHATSTVGCIGTAAGVAWLCGLDEAGIARAMSLAVSMAAGVKGQFGTPAKPLHAGLAARNAVEAAALAEHGMTGRPDILEAPQGFRELFGGPDAAGWDEVAIGAPHVIESEGLMPKRHPCCGSTHNAVDIVLDLRARHGFAAEEVAAVETLVGIANRRNLAYPDPVDEMQARFSMQYCVALALLKDRLDLSDFTADAVKNEAVRSLLPRVTMASYSEQEERAAAGRPLPHRVAIRLADGRVLAGERAAAKGTIADPFDDADRRAKFADCCRGVLDASAAGRLHDRLDRLDAEPDLSFLEPALARAGQPTETLRGAGIASRQSGTADQNRPAQGRLAAEVR
ncbi:MmgE/PrpD family protein [Inquilinus limosus]|uniref:2-methylcitrate dehydratase n=1 Tax=Inquilinus limosus TaxID=171674 RepID=A0A211ZMY0_9PROT|nr:MmgE/PrpD family protein [Inquilinus limosus]OWJ66621.1 2-methylcitrate dehydratase [Inquilinus limosus]